MSWDCNNCKNYEPKEDKYTKLKALNQTICEYCALTNCADCPLKGEFSSCSMITVLNEIEQIIKK